MSENYSPTEQRVAQENPHFKRDDVQAVAGLRSSLLQQGYEKSYTDQIAQALPAGDANNAEDDSPNLGM